MAATNPTVLLTNDDGPPGSESPYIFGLFRHMTTSLGWDVKVVIPSSQKSWIGGAYEIKKIVAGKYYYPTEPDGAGETSSVSRPLRNGEVGEWIILDGTPATCTNIALHNIYFGEIDLLISGPNLGRNSSSAFALSSGTVGAAMSSSLSKVRSIALSYGTVTHPTPKTFFDPAHTLSCRIIEQLWNNWGKDECGLRDGEVDLYNVNLPMVENLLTEEGLKVCWTTMWRNSYGQLFNTLSASKDFQESSKDGGRPDSDLFCNPSTASKSMADTSSLMFKFSPNMNGLINPSLTSLPVGCDAWGFHKGWATVTPLRASYAEPSGEERVPIAERIWK